MEFLDPQWNGESIDSHNGVLFFLYFPVKTFSGKVGRKL